MRGLCCFWRAIPPSLPVPRSSIFHLFGSDCSAKVPRGTLSETRRDDNRPVTNTEIAFVLSFLPVRPTSRRWNVRRGSVLDFRCTSSETRISDRPPVKSKTGFAHYAALLHASLSAGETVRAGTDGVAARKSIDCLSLILGSVILCVRYPSHIYPFLNRANSRNARESRITSH